MKTTLFSIFVFAILITMYSCKPKSITPVDNKVDFDSISQIIIQFNIESNSNSVLVCDLTDRVVSFQTTGIKFNQVSGDLQIGPECLCNKMNSSEISFLCDSILRNFQPIDYSNKSVDDVNNKWSDDYIIVADSDRYCNKILVVFKDGRFKDFSLFCDATDNQSRLIRFLINKMMVSNPNSQGVQYLRELLKKYE